MGLPVAMPVRATVMKPTGDLTMSPPMTRAPNSRQISLMPEYSSLTSSTSVSAGSPRVTRANAGVPPIAATSLTLEAITFQPKSRHGVVSEVKWIPSTMVSVVYSSVTPAVTKVTAAASSPLSTTARQTAARLFSTERPGSRVHCCTSSMRPNSPRSEMRMVQIYKRNGPFFKGPVIRRSLAAD